MNFADNLRSLAAMVRAEREIQAATETQLRAWVPLFLAALVQPGTSSVAPSTQHAEHTKALWLTGGMIAVVGVALAARRKRYKKMRPSGYNQHREDVFAVEVKDTLRLVPDRSFKVAHEVIQDGIRAGWTAEQIQNEVIRRVYDAIDGTSEQTGRLIGPSTINSGTLDAFIDIQAATGERFVKSWVSMMDDKVRPTHRAANDNPHNQGIALTVKFDVGGYLADRPRDPELPIWESGGCRCIAAVDPA